MSYITYDYIKNSPEVRAYIELADKTLTEMGFTEHSYPHVTKVAETAGEILTKLNFDERTIELAKIAGFLHDIGNVINRTDHAISGANMAFVLLNKLNVPADEIGKIVTCIGHHDDKTAFPVSPISAAVIIADKTDVRRTRVRTDCHIGEDIHDRVNYAAKSSSVIIDSEGKSIAMQLEIDTEVSAVMEYFEIFLDRMLLCKKAAKYLGVEFKVIINDLKIL